MHTHVCSHTTQITTINKTKKTWKTIWLEAKRENETACASLAFNDEVPANEQVGFKSAPYNHIARDAYTPTASSAKQFFARISEKTK